MKKIASILGFIIITGVFSGVLFAASVPQDAAKQVAVNWINEMLKKDYTLDSISEVFIETENSQKVYYVFNFVPEGWIIISADDVAFPVIGYSGKGSYSSVDKPPAFNNWMNKIKKEIKSVIGKQLQSRPATRNAWSRFNMRPYDFKEKSKRSILSDPIPPTYPQVGPLVQTTWSQRQYYNTACPADDGGYDGHVVTGCVATAMAQIMRYHGYPDMGVGSHSYDHQTYGVLSADFGLTDYNWAAIPAAGSIQVYNNTVATLLYHCGVSVEMNYGPGSSSASTVDAVDALRNYFKYDESISYQEKINYPDEQWRSLLKAEMDAGGPIIYSGEGSGGHAFICDGYDSATPTLFHFNWGWGGYNDGYFSLNALTPGDHNYTNEQEGIFGIKPATIPNLIFPYFGGFEGGSIPGEWVTSGNHAVISTADAHSGTHSLLLGEPSVTDTGTYLAILKINVPAGGAALSFWVKRGSDFESPYNKQSALIKAQFGTSALHTIFEGDFHDSGWQLFSVDLSVWKGEVVKLYFEQKRSDTINNQWIYIDDVEITESPIADFKAERIEWFANLPLKFTNLSVNAQSYSWIFTNGIPPSSTVPNPTVSYAIPGTYSVTLVATNGSGSDTKTRTDYITIFPEPSIPYSNDFNTDGGGFYAYVLSGSGGKWEWGSCSSNNFNGNYATIEGAGSWATVLNGNHGFDTRYALESPPFSLADKNGTYYLQFQYRAVCGTGAGMHIDYSKDGGSTWNLLGNVNDPNASSWYNEPSLQGLDNQPGWSQSSFTVFNPLYKINFLIGESDIRFRFIFGAGNSASDGFQVDRFRITAVELTYPYTEGFEGGNIPNLWETSGAYCNISTADAHSGTHSLLLSGPSVQDSGDYIASLKINVPANAAALSFWVKRGYDPSPSQYNQQYASIESEFGATVLHTFFDGDYNDTEWQKFDVDLSNWNNDVVILHFKQKMQSTSYKQWMYIDDIQIAETPAPVPKGDVNGDGNVTLADVIIALKVACGVSTGSVNIKIAADVNGDAKIGLEEVIYILQDVANLK